jgi:alkane 1-monooxygenase
VASLRFLPLFLIPALTACGLLAQDWRLWLTPAFSFFVVPLLDQLAGDSPEGGAAAAAADIALGRAITCLYVPVQLAVLVLGVRAAAGAHWTPVQWAGAVLSTGLMSGGLGITIAHELVHRVEPRLRALGGVLLSSVCYGHFMVEHVHGHHTWVATPRDPSSARRGESAFRFYPRTVLGTFLSALVLEREHRAKRGKSFLHDRVLLTWLLTLAFAAAALSCGPRGLAFFLAQSVVAFSLLELINYVEHYGLSRRELSPGRYEGVDFTHSWDSRRIVSNIFLINLQRHSDHHKYPTRDFPALRFHETAPVLPAGYPVMLLLALCPPAWFRVMDRRLGATARSNSSATSSAL